jgi:hydrogenase maturation protein HypF
MPSKRIDINGVVQGVGFRPFIYGLARKHRISGEVSNTDDGVSLTITGQTSDIENFIQEIKRNPPLLADIHSLEAIPIPDRQFDAFKIVKSQSSDNRSTLISPDVTVCKDCLKELNDPDDPRFEYPFINCTNCGPRYTIIEDIPYDRPQTSMKSFNMCPACQKEYDDPLDRRFHAQPNACPKCGPQIFLADRRGTVVQSDPHAALNQAAACLAQGKIIGIKGLGGFHLACDAKNEDTVLKLRRQKNRPHKPFALMARDVTALSAHVSVNSDEKHLLESYHSPIILLKKRPPKNQSRSEIAPSVARHNNELGCMLPSTPLHHLLLSKGPDILVMTSGNRSGEPLSIDNADAIDAFSHVADFFLLHDRDIFFGADDSVARFLEGQTRFIRRSRGYAPLPLYLKSSMPPILACGAGLKNTICLTRNRQAFLSPHIGDLENIKVFDYFKKNIGHLKQILDIQPQIIAHDLHPGYMSTEYAVEQKGIKKSGGSAPPCACRGLHGRKPSEWRRYCHYS